MGFISKKKEPEHDQNDPPITSIVGNRIVELSQIAANLNTNTVCRACSEKKLDEAMLQRDKDEEDFFDFVEKYEDQILYLEKGYPNTKLPPKKGIRHLRREYDKSKIGEATAKTSTTSDSFRLVENTIGLATTLSCK